MSAQDLDPQWKSCCFRIQTLNLSDPRLACFGVPIFSVRGTGDWRLIPQGQCGKGRFEAKHAQQLARKMSSQVQ